MLCIRNEALKYYAQTCWNQYCSCLTTVAKIWDSEDHCVLEIGREPWWETWKEQRTGTSIFTWCIMFLDNRHDKWSVWQPLNRRTDVVWCHVLFENRRLRIQSWQKAIPVLNSIEQGICTVRVTQEMLFYFQLLRSDLSPTYTTVQNVYYIWKCNLFLWWQSLTFSSHYSSLKCHMILQKLY